MKAKILSVWDYDPTQISFFILTSVPLSMKSFIALASIAMLGSLAPEAVAKSSAEICQGQRCENEQISRPVLVETLEGGDRTLIVKRPSRLCSGRTAQYVNRAIQKAQQNNDQAALEDFNQIVVMDPICADVYYNRGVLHEKMNNHLFALRDYERTIALDPKYADAYYNLGLIKKDKLNNVQEAIKDFRTAAKLYRAQGQTAKLKSAVNSLRELGVK
jgi:tetratricopeptide (TPR) repeat protein